MDARKSYVRQNAFAFPLKATCPSSSSLFVVSGHARIQNRVELISIRPREITLNQFINLAVRIDLEALEVGLQVMKLIGIGLLAEDCCAVIIGKRRLDRVGIVHEIQNENVVLQRMARLRRERVCTALMPESGLSTYIVCKSGSS